MVHVKRQASLARVLQVHPEGGSSIGCVYADRVFAARAACPCMAQS